MSKTSKMTQLFTLKNRCTPRRSMNNNGATENNGIRVKILTIGDSGVGKTCLIMRFSGEEFVQSFITTVGIGKFHSFKDMSRIPIF